MLNSMFNQELHFRKREHKFIEEFNDLNLGRLFIFKNLGGSDEATSWGRSGQRSPRCRLHFLLVDDFSRLMWVVDKAFYAVVKTHKHRSNKIYNTELKMTKI